MQKMSEKLNVGKTNALVKENTHNFLASLQGILVCSAYISGN